MNNDLKDILANTNKDIDNQQLMDYLSNQLSKADAHAVEKNMADNEFMNDAIEGLQKMDSKKDLQAYVEELNEGLQKQIVKNKTRKEKRRLKDQPYTYVALVIILILLVICFMIIKRHLDAGQAKPAVSHQIFSARQ